MQLPTTLCFGCCGSIIAMLLQMQLKKEFINMAGFPRDYCKCCSGSSKYMQVVKSFTYIYLWKIPEARTRPRSQFLSIWDMYS